VTGDLVNRRAFTLIELVIVVAMIGVIAAIVLPRLDPFLPARRLKGAARSLSGAISLAYGESVAKNATYRLYLDPQNDRYWVVEVKKVEGEEESASASGIRIGTQFELLQRADGSDRANETLTSEPLFAPTALPDGVHFSSVETGGERGMLASSSQYIEFDPLGNGSPAVIALSNEDGERVVIRYDGVTGIPVLASPTGGPA
jgi:prepilin-type N-terminal cleavage/methylation domain-containing protein